MVKNLPANAGDTRDVGLIPGKGRYLGGGGGGGGGNGNPLSILAWEVPWTEESGQLQSMGSRRVRHD